jgi:hypothetical protein
MSIESKKIEASINERLSKMNCLFKAALIGESVDHDKWRHDLWIITIDRARKPLFITQYRTGLGLRKKVSFNTAGLQIAPTAAGVLYSLTIDAASVNSSFDDWALEFGYDSDSIKSANIYQECCKIGKELRNVFSAAEISELRELLQDY